SQEKGTGSSLLEPPPPPSSTALAERRRSKWDVQGGTASAPSRLQDSVPPEPDIKSSERQHRVITLPAHMIRVLIGKAGSTIRDICSRSGADIKVNHLPHEPEGSISVVGDISRTEAIIQEVLRAKGCAWSPEGRATVAPTQEEVKISSDLVGMLIGKGGETIREIKEKCGGAVSISVQPASTPGPAWHSVRIVGDNWQMAKALVKAKIEEISKANASTSKGKDGKGGKGEGKDASFQGMRGGGLGAPFCEALEPPPQQQQQSQQYQSQQQQHQHQQQTQQQQQQQQQQSQQHQSQQQQQQQHPVRSLGAALRRAAPPPPTTTVCCLNNQAPRSFEDQGLRPGALLGSSSSSAGTPSGTGDSMPSGQGDWMQNGKGDWMPSGKGDWTLGGKGDWLLGGKGDWTPNGTGHSMPSGRGDSMPRGKGDWMPGGKGDWLPNGKGDWTNGGKGDSVPSGKGDWLPGGRGDWTPSGGGDSMPSGKGDWTSGGKGDWLPNGKGDRTPGCKGNGNIGNTNTNTGDLMSRREGERGFESSWTRGGVDQSWGGKGEPGSSVSADASFGWRGSHSDNTNNDSTNNNSNNSNNNNTNNNNNNNYGWRGSHSDSGWKAPR
ncbi:unnamed protein product, partial [Polarella glacialis]